MRSIALRLLSLLLLALAPALAPARAGAQRVLGPGPEAVTIPRGTLRTTILGESVLHRGRWNEGSAEDLGAGFSVSALAAPHLSWLAALDANVAALGVSGLNASLGETHLTLRQRLAITHLGFEYGLTDRITVSVDAPFVRTRVEALLRARGDSGRATAGVNPYFIGTGVPLINRTTIDRYTSAATSLAARRTSCLGNAGAFPECATILAEATLVNDLIASAQQFATGLATTYGAQGLSEGLPYVPMAGSTAEQLLLQRVDAFRTDFTRYGVTDIAALTGLPVGAQTPLSADQLAAIVANTTTGYGAQPMTRTSRQDLGDIDIGVRLNVYDDFAGDSARLAANSRGIRQTVGVIFRVGGGNFDLPDNFVDLGTGSGHSAVSVRSYTDLMLNDRFYATVTLGWARGFSHDRDLRIPSFAGVEWLEAWRTASVRVEPGSVLEMRVAPRWVINDYFSLGSEWRWRSKGEDRHIIANDVLAAPPPNAVALLPNVLNSQSDWNEHRWAWHVSYSTLAAESRGRTRVPLEIGYTHEQSIASSVGTFPRRWEDRVQIRYYTRFLGR